MNRELPDRDLAVLQVLDQLTQLSTHHIKTLLFSTVTRQVMDKVLGRLRDDRLIKRIGVRATAHRGGTPPGVYTLTNRGYFHLGQTNKSPRFTINEHTLLVADLFVGLVAMDRASELRLLPETNVEHSSSGFRVDLYFDGVLQNDKRRRRYVEVQRTLRKDVINQKLTAHWNAYEAAVGQYPKVVFVVTDEYHVYLIKRLIPAERKKLFDVVLSGDFTDYIIAA